MERGVLENQITKFVLSEHIFLKEEKAAWYRTR